MSETSSANKAKKRKKKDLNLAECRFQIDCEAWLSQKYQNIAEVLYSRHIKERQQPKYKSEKIQRLAYKCLDEFEYYPDPNAQKEVLATLRRIISEPVRHHTIFDILDFADYFDILSITPNEILKIAPELSENPMRTLKVLNEKQVKEIRDNFSEFSNGNKKLCLTCLCFPMFGILGITIICDVGYYDKICGLGPSVEYAILIPESGKNAEEIYQTLYFDSYEQMEKAFYDAVSGEADRKWIDKLAQLEGFKLLVDHFMNTDYLIGRSTTITYEKLFSVDAKDSPTA